MPITHDRTADERTALGLLMPGFSGTTAPPWLLDAARDGLAGVVLFAGNTPDVATTRALTDVLHAAGPVLVAVDEEGGDVSRLQAATGSGLPGAAALGAVDDVDLTRRAGAALGALLGAAGIDLDLAPDLDVASEPRNPVIGVRSFGPDPDRVARHGAAFVTGLHDGGVAACGKHFPGHGATTTDSHLVLPRLDVDRDLLATRDLPPFEAASGAGMDALMTGHLLIPTLGPSPASLEPEVTALARGLDGGEDRVIITDALDMGAVAGEALSGFGEACVRALEAGADLLCLGTTTGRDDEAMFRTAVTAVVDALRAGRLDHDALRRSIERTDVLRRRVRDLRGRTAPIEAEDALRRLDAVGAEAAGRAVRAVGSLPGMGEAPLLLDLRRRINHAAGRTSPAFAAALARRRPGAAVLVADGAERPLPELLAQADPTGVLVLTREPLADPDERADLEATLAVRPGAVVIHAGTAESAPAAPHLVLAHGVGRANAEAALDLVLGRTASGDVTQEAR